MSRIDRRGRSVSLPLWAKLLGGYVLVSLVAVAILALLANRSTTRQFQLYVSQGRQLRAQRLALEFAAYYAQTGSWAGVEGWTAELNLSESGGSGQGRRQGRGQGPGTGNDRLLLADPGGRVLADSEQKAVGETLTSAELLAGVPVEFDGQRIGTLLVTAPGAVYESLEAGFLRKINQSLLLAGLAAVAVAIAVGLLLARQLTAPLRELTHAVQQLAHWRPNRPNVLDVPQVGIRSRDEIGELGQAFDQMARSLAEQEKLRRDLMADIAHELRTPLTVIRGDLEALLDGVFEPTPETLASLQEETLLLSRLVDDLRALAQSEAGQLQLERQPTDLAELLRGVVASFDLQAQSQGQTLTLALAPDLPQVDADPQRVRQVVANLVSNALRHVPGNADSAGGGKVAVSAVRDCEMLQVSVADNGPGIAPEDLPHVFDRFWQADRVRAGSSGLGLAIAQELVRTHGGQIWVESTPGQGAAFRFTLPVARSDHEPKGR
jgi:signal transduction histidine kinase